MLGRIAQQVYDRVLRDWRESTLWVGVGAGFEPAFNPDGETLRNLPDAKRYRVVVQKGGADRVGIDVSVSDVGEGQCQLFGYYEVAVSRGTYRVMQPAGHVGGLVEPDAPSLLDACTVMMHFDVHQWRVEKNSLKFRLSVGASYLWAGSDAEERLFTCFLRPEGGKLFAVVEQFELKGTVGRYATREDFIAWAGRVAGATTADGAVSVSKWRLGDPSVLLLMERAVGVLADGAAPPTACDGV